MTAKSPVNIVLGAGAFGRGNSAGMKCVDDTKVIQELFDEFKKRGYNQIDTARIYGGGTSEAILYELGYDKQGLVLDTKVASFAPGSHNKENLAKSVDESLSALHASKVNILYLHAPDRTVPLEEVLAGINDQFKQGRFAHFGLSNYKADEVEQIVKIAKEKGYVLPTVYQGLYNLVSRANEKELFPVLRKHGISFYAYSPLGGSFLTGEFVSKDKNYENSRFDQNTMVGAIYRDKFWKESYFTAVQKLKETAEKKGWTLPDISLRWIVHHSQLKKATNDAVIIGPTRMTTLVNSLDAVEQPPLPEEVLKIIDDIWESIKHEAASYHM